MKNIKIILFVIISSCAVKFVQAQETSTKIAKPAISSLTPNSVPETKPNPQLEGTKQVQQPALKESVEKPVVTNDKDEQVKPQAVKTENKAARTSPGIQSESRQNAVNRVPLIPAPVGNITPVTTPVPKKAVPAEQQQ